MTRFCSPARPVPASPTCCCGCSIAGFALVADDQVIVEDRTARAPAALAGLLEVRGLGIFRLPFLAAATPRLVVRLGIATERLPAPALDPDFGLPMVTIDPQHPSAPARVALALEAACAPRHPARRGLRGMSRSAKRAVVLVTGLSGAGKISILRMLEDLGFETMDNPPLDTLETLAVQAKGNLAVGVDARSRGFAADTVLRKLQRLHENPSLAPTLLFAAAADDVLLRRYSETRRRHPLAQTGTVADGIRLERELTLPLAHGADVLIDTSQLPLPRLRAIIEQNFGADAPGLAVALISFAYPAGLPREADLVFDARFLRNPYYDPSLRPLCGRDPEVGRFIEDDPDFSTYFSKILDLVKFLLPRFVQEGKKYATICVGCTGGQHRSVYMIEKLGTYLSEAGWRVGVTHREAGKFESARNGLTMDAKE